MNSSTAVVAEQLGLLDEQLPLVGLQRELADHRSDDGPRGLGAAVEEQERLLEDVAGLPALRDPHRDEVVPGVAATRLDHLGGLTVKKSCITGMTSGCDTYGGPPAMFSPPRVMVRSDH